jgi:tyrosine-protein kinase Etk/Wzc
VEIFAFTITMRHDDAEQAADIVNTFVEAAVAENLRVRAERARDTRVYFQEQVERVADRIVEVESEIAAFKRENEGTLPESLESRRDELVRLQESAMEIERRRLEITDQRLTVELALNGENPVRTGELAPRSPEEAELRRLSVELAQRRRILAPNNPELRRLEERIAAIAELVPSGAADAVTLVTLGEPNSEQQGVLRRQMTLFDEQIHLLQQQRTTLEARREALEASLQVTPQVAVALNALERRLSGLQDQHTVLVQRYAEARTGEELETNEQSERFRVVENALAPDYPIEPNRRKIVLLGSGASVGLAFALAFLLEMMNPVLRTSAQMERQLGLRPVVSIPYVRTRWERRRQRMAWATALVVVALGGSLGVNHALNDETSMALLSEKMDNLPLFGSVLGTTVAEAEAPSIAPDGSAPVSGRP